MVAGPKYYLNPGCPLREFGREHQTGGFRREFDSSDVDCVDIDVVFGVGVGNEGGLSCNAVPQEFTRELELILTNELVDQEPGRSIPIPRNRYRIHIHVLSSSCGVLCLERRRNVNFARLKAANLPCSGKEDRGHFSDVERRGRARR